jgi:hypothetical protein
MSERVVREKAVTKGHDSRLVRSWHSTTSVRDRFVRLGHKCRRQWERREIERQERAA